jgi:hypothetical protein
LNRSLVRVSRRPPQGELSIAPSRLFSQLLARNGGGPQLPWLISLQYLDKTGSMY